MTPTVGLVEYDIDAKKQDPGIYWPGRIRHREASGSISKLKESPRFGKQRHLILRNRRQTNLQR